MTTRSSRARQSAAVTVLVLAVATAVWAAPELSFESDRIIADGVTNGGVTWWFGVVQGSRGWDHVVKRVDRVISDDDADGSVELVWSEGSLPRQSVWLVVDAVTGRYATAAPPGMSLRTLDLGPDDLVYNGDDVVGVSKEQVRYLEAFLAQPGFGAWSQTSGDGTPSDGDGTADGKIVISFAQMRSGAGDMPAPESAATGDIVAVIDALELRLGVYSIGGGAAAALQAGEEVAR